MDAGRKRRRPADGITEQNRPFVSLGVHLTFACRQFVISRSSIQVRPPAPDSLQNQEIQCGIRPWLAARPTPVQQRTWAADRVASPTSGYPDGALMRTRVHGTSLWRSTRPDPMPLAICCNSSMLCARKTRTELSVGSACHRLRLRQVGSSRRFLWSIAELGLRSRGCGRRARPSM